MSIPSLQEQGQIIKKLRARYDISPENGAYAISDEWYSHFIGSTRKAQSDENVNVPEIDNTKIAMDNNHIKPDIEENVDYQILSKEVWDQLHEWYKGGPEIKLNVVLNEANEPIAISKFTTIQILYKESKSDFIINGYMKVDDLIDFARKTFNIPDTEEIQIYDYFNDHYNATMESGAELHRYNLSMGQKVLVDYKDENGKWVNLPEKEENKQSYFSGTSSTTRTVNRTQSYDFRSPGEHGSSPGKCGLANLGNTCFFNSGTQCLMHTMPFVKYFVDGTWEQWINTTNKLGTKGALATAFASVARKMWGPSPEPYIRPTELKHAVGRFAPRFSGYEQHDSHELILFMLDGIHEDLNRCKNKPYVESVTGDGSNDQAIADESWKRHKLRNDSIVVDHFHGLLRSELLCPKCHKTTIVFDPYLAIPLPLARENDRKIRVIFVPWDTFREEWQKVVITIKVSYLANANVISQEISKKLGRNVFCAPATYQPYSRKLTWGFSDSSSAYYTHFHLAFEIPDQSKFYVPCALIGPQVSQFSVNAISPVFLVQADSVEDATPEKLLEASRPRIEPLLDLSADCEISEEATKYIEKITSDQTSTQTSHQKDDKDDGQTDDKKEDQSEEPKESAEFEKDFWSRTCGPKKDKVIPFVSTTGLRIKFPLSKVNLKLCAKNLLFNTSRSTDSSDPKANQVTLDNCFKLFTAPDTLDEQNQWYCPYCKDFVCADKKLDVWSTPEILIIQLKRFSGSGYFLKKDDTFVDFPDELDMSKYCLSHPQGVSQKYRLYAVSEHMGGMGGGHYIAHARVTTSPSDPGQWYCFDDSHCSPASPEAAHSPLAYVLFYQRIDQ